MTVQLPKGDDESVNEEDSSEILETPTEIMHRRINDVYEETLPLLDKMDLGEKR